MKFKRHLEPEHGLKQIDITPAVNIVFLLLIFFMLTSSFVAQPGINVSLPRALTSEAVKHDNIDIVISAENSTYVNGKAVAVRDMAGLLIQAAKQDRSVLIKSDKRASLGKVVEIWDLCRNAGISQINIATDQQ